MPESTHEVTPEVAALKSGLGPFYGRLLAAAERIADALEGAPPKKTTTTGRRPDA